MDESRKDQRVKVQTLKAKYKSATIDEFIEQYAGDISRGGIFIKTTKPAANGTLLKIEIQLRDASPVISAVGRVVWRREAPVGKEPAGMGIKFIKVDESSQGVIDRVVASRPAGEGPQFEEEGTPSAEEALAKPAGATQSDFFGQTNPEAEMPATQDRTMMRQMSAFLGEALRSTSEGGDAPAASTPPPPAAKEEPVAAPARRPASAIKQTIVGMPAVQSQRPPSSGTVLTGAAPPPVAAPPGVSVPETGASGGTVLTGAAPPPARMPTKSTIVGMPSVRPPAPMAEIEEEPTKVTGRDKLDALIKEAEKPSVPPVAKPADTVDAKPASAPAAKPVVEETPVVVPAVAAAAVIAAEASRPEPVGAEPKKPDSVRPAAIEPKKPAVETTPARATTEKLPDAARTAKAVTANAEPLAPEAKKGNRWGTMLGIAAALALAVVGVAYYTHVNASNDASSNGGDADAGAASTEAAVAEQPAATPDAAAAAVMATPDAGAMGGINPTPPAPETGTVRLTGLRPGAQVFADDVEQTVAADGTLSLPTGHAVALRVHATGYQDQTLSTTPTAAHATTVAVHQTAVPAVAPVVPAGQAGPIVAPRPRPVVPHPAVPVAGGTTTGTTTTTTETHTETPAPAGSGSGSTGSTGATTGSSTGATEPPAHRPARPAGGTTGTGTSGSGSSGSTGAAGSGSSPDNPY